MLNNLKIIFSIFFFNALFCSETSLQNIAARKIQKKYRLTALQKKIQKDLDAIKDILKQNHPAAVSPFDADFNNILENGYVQACAQISKAKNEQDHIQILKDFAKRFQDSHLYIEVLNAVDDQFQSELQSLKHFETIIIAPNIVKIILPTFQPEGMQIEELKTVIDQMPEYRKFQTIIFDVRGNAGGISQWAEDICKSLFGVPNFEYCKYQLQKSETVWWRASLQNLQYLQKLMPILVEQLGNDSSMVAEFKIVVSGMERAYHVGQNFYVERPNVFVQMVEKPINPVKAKIIVLIDSRCVSACLDFIDYLKILSSDVTLVGQTTKADSMYMELRSELLPSKKAKLNFPIKMYQGRLRGHNQPYQPDIVTEGILSDDQLLETVLL